MKEEAVNKDVQEAKGVAGGESAQASRQTLSNEAVSESMKKIAPQGDTLPQISDAHKDMFPYPIESMKPRDGVQQLSTGDFIVRDGGKQTYFGEGGQKITINPDGSHTVSGDVTNESTDKDGRTTVKFADGSSVTFDKNGFRTVERNDQGVILDRNGNVVGGYVKAHPMWPPKDFPPIHIPKDIPPIIMYDSQKK